MNSELENILLDEFCRAWDECYIGADEDGYFLEPEDPGLFNLMISLGHEEASRPIAGKSIANHVYHLVFATNIFIRRLLGDEGACKVDWNASWRERPLSYIEWDALKQELLAVRRNEISVIHEHCDIYDREYMKNFAGHFAHTAFHYGVIRVKFDELKKSNDC